MILIVDTNIIFSGLLRDSVTREMLIDCPFVLYVPETVLFEIRKYENEIIKRSGLTKREFETLFSLITENITIVEKEKYQTKITEADKLIGHIDKGDVPFVALALTIPNNGIWTENEVHFKKQNKVKIWTTSDILKGLSDI